MLSRRLLSPTTSWSARLVAGSNTTPLTSVSSEWARTLPPAAPPLPTTRSNVRSKPPPSTPKQRQPIPIPQTTATITKEEVEVEEERREVDDVRLEDFFLRVLSQLPASPTTPGSITVQRLIEDSKTLAGTVLENVSIPYESTPIPSRRVRTDGTVATTDRDQDGIVLVAHVVGGEKPRVSISTGFAVGNDSQEKGQMLLTCSHTLNRIEGHLRRTKDSSTLPSATLVLTSSGHVYTISSLLSSLPASDLLLLRLSSSPIDQPSSTTSSSPSACPPLRSLPINPYPSPTSTLVFTHTYINPLTRLSRKLQKLPERVWQKGRIVEYKDPIGRTAEPGTYDELGSFWMSSVPTDGSSGGPVVEVETGSVVGVTRGSTHKYGERAQYGFATPAERVLDMFALPGFKTSAQRQSEGLEKTGVAKVHGQEQVEEGRERTGEKGDRRE